MAQEIERVFLLDGLPEFPGAAETLRIEQGYFAPAVGDDRQDRPHHEGRLRRMTRMDGSTHCTHTIKRGAGMVREEDERAIDDGTFEQLWPQTAPRRLTKTRYRVADGPVTWEVDDFDQFEFVLAEVELADPTQHVEPPAWLRDRIVREVTDDARYLNYTLARSLAGEADPPSS